MLNRKTASPNGGAQPRAWQPTASQGKSCAGASAFCHYQQCAAECRQVAGSERQIQDASAISVAEGKIAVQRPGWHCGSGPAQSTVDLTETIKTLLHLAQEHGYITYDDINDVLPDNLSPDDLGRAA